MGAGLARGFSLTAYNLGARRQTLIEVAHRVPIVIKPRFCHLLMTRASSALLARMTRCGNGEDHVYP